MIGKFLSFWVSIPLAIVLGLAPGFWVCMKWEGGAFDGWSYTVPIPFLHPVIRLPESSLDKATKQLAALNARAAANGRAITALNAAERRISAAAAADHKAAQARIQALTHAEIKEVPVYVDPQAVSRCTVNVGFVRLFNAAAAGGAGANGPSPAAGDDNDAPSGVGLDTVERITVSNFGQAHLAIEEVKTWRGWYASTYAAWAAAQRATNHLK